MERPFSPVYHEAVRPVLFGQSGNLLLDPEPLRADHFMLQADRFALALKSKEPLPQAQLGQPLPEAQPGQVRPRQQADGLPDWAVQARYMDAVRDAAALDRWVSVLP